MGKSEVRQEPPPHTCLAPRATLGKPGVLPHTTSLGADRALFLLFHRRSPQAGDHARSHPVRPQAHEPGQPSLLQGGKDDA